MDSPASPIARPVAHVGGVSLIVGIEVGGTFSDLVLVDEANGTAIHKLPSTPAGGSGVGFLSFVIPLPAP